MTACGVVGLGQMGRGIARRLDTVGLLVAAQDTDRGARDAAALSDGVQDDCAGVDVLLFVVPGAAQITAALEEMPLRQGSIIVDMTTSDPQCSIRLAKGLAERGCGYIDAAMTGGATGADAGSLTLMLGGDAEVIARVEPVLEKISTRRFHMGPVGAGHAMKLVHNLILHSAFMATCEGLTLAQKAGLDLHRAVEVLNAGNARSFVTEVRFPRDILSGAMSARSRIANLEKDLGLARGFADDLGGPSRYAELTHAMLARAVSNGDGQMDFSHLFAMTAALEESIGDA